MPDDAGIEGLDEISLGEVEDGDLLFFSKTGKLQQLFWVVNDVWLHSGLAVTIGEERCVAEATAADKLASRTVASAAARYEYTAVGRPKLPQDCVAAAARWAADQVGTPQEYAWDDFILAGLVALTRRGLPAFLLDDLGEALQEALMNEEDAPKQSRTCSAFVHEAFSQAGAACGLPIDTTDLSGLGRTESALTYSAVAEMSPDRRAEVLERTPVFDLLSADVRREEMTERMGESHITAQQGGRVLRMAFDVVRTYVDRTISGADEGSDQLPGRWCTPTDLWRSPLIEHVGILGPGGG